MVVFPHRNPRRPISWVSRHFKKVWAHMLAGVPNGETIFRVRSLSIRENMSAETYPNENLDDEVLHNFFDFEYSSQDDRALPNAAINRSPLIISNAGEQLVYRDIDHCEITRRRR
jgi:hypothetical protein